MYGFGPFARDGKAIERNKIYASSPLQCFCEMRRCFKFKKLFGLGEL